MRLNYQYQLIQAIRNFFNNEGFLDVITPPLVQNPGMETHIHPFMAYSVNKKQTHPLYLHTSPEFCMKDLLSRPEEQLDKIFSIGYAFRDEPRSPIHREQFLMLEWYRKNARYEEIMSDTKKLIDFCFTYLQDKNAPMNETMTQTKWFELTVSELIYEYTKISILDFLDKKELKNLLIKDFKDVPLPSQDLHWDDYFFLFFLNKIEPHMNQIPKLLLKEFPAPLAALSTLKQSDTRVCERFEVYLNGVELCNAFNELTDLTLQKKRFTLQSQEKFELYNYRLPEPVQFYESLERGLPPCAGIALGIERLLYSITNIKNPFYQ